jgi:pyruvate/2-oxoglutarate/acetoin dehydrogenase E1 component
MPTVLDSLNSALHGVMQADERVYFLGEDILDPYGGAFKVSRGLSSAFPKRVLTTPVSEAGIVGVAAGMALRGLLPVVEIMFGDFTTLIADQLVNHIAKFRWMYNEQVRVPIVIRVPMGGRRGYGPTHSQSLEKLYLGVPGLRVLAPTSLGDPGELLSKAILEDEDPVLFIEHKLLYQAALQDEDSLADFTLSQTFAPGTSEPLEALSFRHYPQLYTLVIKDAPPPALTLVAYGYMVELAREAVLRLAYEHEIFAELVVPEQLAPFELKPVFDSVQRTHRLMVVEEANQTMGWGAEVLARACEKLRADLMRVGRLGAKDLPIPASGPLEAAVLPSSDDIIHAVQKKLYTWSRS